MINFQLFIKKNDFNWMHHGILSIEIVRDPFEMQKKWNNLYYETMKMWILIQLQKSSNDLSRESTKFHVLFPAKTTKDIHDHSLLIWTHVFRLKYAKVTDTLSFVHVFMNWIALKSIFFILWYWCVLTYEAVATVSATITKWKFLDIQKKNYHLSKKKWMKRKHIFDNTHDLYLRKL